MVVVITKEDLCIISNNYHRYSFSKEFLSEKLWQGLRMLPAFRNSPSIFPLDHKEELTLNIIFEKLISEQRSGYMYSEDLQRTHLIELIHFINKLGT
jgi:hypothetical protein